MFMYACVRVYRVCHIFLFFSETTSMSWVAQLQARRKPSFGRARALQPFWTIESRKASARWDLQW